MPKEFRPERTFARELYEKKEAGYERGKNVHIKVSFICQKELGESALAGLPEIIKAMDRGKEIPHQYIMVASSRIREPEMAALELESATGPEGMATAVNKRIQREKVGLEELAAREYIIYRHGDLDPVKRLKNIWLEGEKKAEEAVDRGEIPADKKENYQYEYYLNNPDRAKELGAQTPREVAQDMAHRVASCLQMSGRLYEGIDLNARNYTHVPKLECLLKYVLRQKSGKLGFDKLDEVGGPFKSGESFDLDVKRDEKGDLKPVRILRGGKELGILDLDAVRELEEEYRKRKEEKE